MLQLRSASPVHEKVFPLASLELKLPVEVFGPVSVR